MMQRTMTRGRVHYLQVAWEQRLHAFMWACFGVWGDGLLQLAHIRIEVYLFALVACRHVVLYNKYAQQSTRCSFGGRI